MPTTAGSVAGRRNGRARRVFWYVVNRGERSQETWPIFCYMYGGRGGCGDFHMLNTREIDSTTTQNKCLGGPKRPRSSPGSNVDPRTDRNICYATPRAADTNTAVGSRSAPAGATARAQHGRFHGSGISTGRAAPGPPRLSPWLQIAHRSQPEK